MQYVHIQFRCDDTVGLGGAFGAGIWPGNLKCNVTFGEDLRKRAYMN